MSPDDTVKESADIKVSVADLSAARRSITVVVPGDQVGSEYEKACRSYARTLRVPGFRRGKVPLPIVKQRFGREIEQETVEKVMRRTLDQAVADSHLKPLRAPVLKEYTYKPGEPLSFTAEFEVRPRVEVRGADDIRVKIAEPAVTDRMVSEALEGLRERAARFDPVEGRGLRPGDHALLDIRGRFAPGEGRDFARDNLLMEIGSAGPNPELTDELKGMRPGETREFSVAYPQEHPATDLAGRRVGYTVTLREIKEKVLPDLDDEFARDVGDFATLEDLKRSVSQDLLARQRRRAREEARGEAIEQLLRSNPDVEAPEALVDEEIERRVDDLARSMILQGMDPRLHAVDWDEVRRKQREPAARTVRAMILLDAVAEERKITLEPDALDRAVAQEAERRRQRPETLRAKLARDGRLERLGERLLREKVLDFLLATTDT